MKFFSTLQVAVMVLAVGIFPAAKADVFINELHYDNNGGDINEAVEVVATGGEDLSLYSIVLYNGATGQSYDTDPVPAGVLGNCVAGGSALFSTVIPGLIQNGNPDGLALVGPTGVVQFLSYGGAFGATNDAANGLMSQNIGVTEAANSAVGLSLQLTGGPGATYASFAWAGSSDDNFGACNTGQSFGAPVVKDNAPTVVSSVPTDNAINVVASSNISITFSEPVTFTPTFRTRLLCSNSGFGALRTYAVSGGPTVYTVNPDIDFDEGDCTLTIYRTNVADQDGAATPMAANFVLHFSAVANPVDSYYNSVDTTSCLTLRNTLHDLIDDHIAYPYSSASTDTWDILEAADQDPLDPTRVLEVYENNSHAKFGGGVGPYNREHTWPNAYGFNNLSNAPGDIPESAAYTDTHMLYLSDVEYNSDRGSKPYADCPQAAGCSARATLAYNGQGGGAVVYPGNHNWVIDIAAENQDSFEVWNFRKGDMARAVMYMDIRYEGGVATGGNTIGQSEPDLILTDNRNLLVASVGPTGYMGLLSTLLAWHAADPPDAQEQLRNDVIFSYQQNRNPFIDHPEWACVLTNPCTCAL